MENVQEFSNRDNSKRWPLLDYKACKETYNTLHRWVQLIGKIKMCRSPWTNHSWHTTFRVTPFGLTTGSFDAGGKSAVIDLDLLEHEINFRTSDGERLGFGLEPQSVAQFYERVIRALDYLDIEVKFSLTPSEIADAEPFDKDTFHRTYDPFHVQDLFKALSLMDITFKKFRSRFTGKSSTSQFFWGSFDLAVTRFSGREAPEHPAGFPNLPDNVVKEAYSDEVASFGFFPGNDFHPEAAFYSYAYPEPDGYKEAKIEGFGAYYNSDLGEWILPYKNVVGSKDPEVQILSFFQSCYESAAELGNWDRKKLEGSKWFNELKKGEDSIKLH